VQCVEQLQEVEGEGHLRLSHGDREEPGLQQLNRRAIGCTFAKPNASAVNTVCVRNVEQNIRGARTMARKAIMTESNGELFANERVGMFQYY
jgi:hypothetical protein